MTLLDSAKTTTSDLLQKGENALSSGMDLLSSAEHTVWDTGTKLLSDTGSKLFAQGVDLLSGKSSSSTDTSSLLSNTKLSKTAWDAGTTAFAALGTITGLTSLSDLGAKTSALVSDVSDIFSSKGAENLVSTGKNTFTDVKTGDQVKLVDSTTGASSILSGTGWENVMPAVSSPSSNKGDAAASPSFKPKANFDNLVGKLASEQAQQADTYKYLSKDQWTAALKDIADIKTAPAGEHRLVRTSAQGVEVQVGDTKAVRNNDGTFHVAEGGAALIGDSKTGARSLVGKDGQVEAQRGPDGQMRYWVNKDMFLTQTDGITQLHDKSGKVLQEQHTKTLQNIINFDNQRVIQGLPGASSDAAAIAAEKMPQGVTRETYVGTGILGVKEGDSGFVIQSDGRALAYSGNEAIRRDAQGHYFHITKNSDGTSKEEKIDPWQLRASVSGNLAKIVKQITELSDKGSTDIDGQSVTFNNGTLGTAVKSSQTSEQALITADTNHSSVKHEIPAPPPLTGSDNSSAPKGADASEQSQPADSQTLPTSQPLVIESTEDAQGVTVWKVDEKPIVTIAKDGELDTPYGHVDTTGSFHSKEGWVLRPDGSADGPKGTHIDSQGAIHFVDGTTISAEGKVTLGSDAQQSYLAEQAAQALAAASAAMGSIGSGVAGPDVSLDQILSMEASIGVVDGVIPMLLQAGLYDVAGSLQAATGSLRNAVASARETYAKQTAVRAMNPTFVPASSGKNLSKASFLNPSNIASDNRFAFLNHAA